MVLYIVLCLFAWSAVWMIFDPKTSPVEKFVGVMAYCYAILFMAWGLFQ